MPPVEWKDFARPDEVRTFPHGRIELLHIGGGTVGRMTLEPGWRWSNDVKPIAGTEWCEAPHFQYIVSGRIHVKMKDGTESDARAGIGPSPARPGTTPGWSVTSPSSAVDWFGATNYAKPK